MSRRLILAATRTFDRNALRIILRDGPPTWEIVEVCDQAGLQQEIARLGIGAAVASGELVAGAGSRLRAALDRLGPRLFRLGDGGGAVDWGATAHALTAFLESVRAEAIPPIATDRPRFTAALGGPEVTVPPPEPGTDRPIDAVLVAGSTGGPTALIRLLQALPRGPIPWLVAQHMPTASTAAFAAHVGEATGREACEIGAGEALVPGRVHVLPGGGDFRLLGAQGRLVVGRARQEESPFHPNADVLLASAAQLEARFAVVVLSGMGRDGADGAARLEAAGAVVFAQAPETCVVPGMPGATIETCRRAQILDPAAPPTRLVRLLAP